MSSFLQMFSLSDDEGDEDLEQHLFEEGEEPPSGFLCIGLGHRMGNVSRTSVEGWAAAS